MNAKLARKILLSSICLHAVSAAQSDFIRQIQNINGVNLTIDMPVQGASGEVISSELAADMAIFQLYAFYTTPEKGTQILFLDEKSVGTFLPSVQIQTYSEDPHYPTRTRADRPYGIRVNVSGMRDGADVPDYAKTVVINTGYEIYSQGDFLPTGEKGTYVDGLIFRGNGTLDEPAVIQRLPGESPTQAVGVETFEACTLPGAGMETASLAKAEVTIWPVASASILGVEEGKTYLAAPHLGIATVLNAYPKSTTYAQIYKGGEMLGTPGTVIPGTVVTYGEGDNKPEVPQSCGMSFGELDKLVPDDGVYTIEVLTVTPFNNGAPERLAHVSFTVKRTITLNAMMVTIE